MFRVAWWSCALLALASARIYERCELARELLALGVNEDHISTWVCIAYHESRFDTAAQNYGSGDHGILQISELYWCGGGKACGVPCSALRDEDIADDVRCALQVHEEHTRLQGNGFLAWVVYPQHCKHNTKKYLAECDNIRSVKTVDTHSKSHASYNHYNVDTKTNVTSRAYENNQNIDNLLPPYLSLSSIFRGTYGKELDHAKDRNTNWLNYKIDNIDELKLPVKAQGALTTPTSATSTTYVPPVSPWRTIETNQFRKKVVLHDKITTKTTSKTDYASVETIPTSSTTYKPTMDAFRLPSITSTTTIKSPVTTTIFKPFDYKFSTIISKVTPFAQTTATTSTTYKPTTTTTYRPTTSTTYRSTTSTTYRPTTTTTYRPTTSTSYRPTTTTTYRTTARLISTVKPSTDLPSTTESPFKSHLTSSWLFSSTTTKPATTTAQKPTTPRPTTKYVPRYTFTSRTTTNASTTIRTTTTRTPTPKWTTLKPVTTYRTSQTTPKLVITTKSPQQIRQSVFDLYLNPTQKPNLPPYRLDRSSASQVKLKIFAEGTTTPMPSTKSTVNNVNIFGDAAKNYVRRQT